MLQECLQGPVRCGQDPQATRRGTPTCADGLQLGAGTCDPGRGITQLKGWGWELGERGGRSAALPACEKKTRRD